MRLTGDTFLVRAMSYFKDRIWAFVCGVALGMSGNFAYDTVLDHFKSVELRQAAGVELFKRMISAHQSAAISIDPRDGFQVFSTAYSNTSSKTDDERFEGKRIDNLIHTIYTRTNDENIKLLLEKIKYFNSEIPWFFLIKNENLNDAEEKNYRDEFDMQKSKISDYACCLANIFSINDGMCTPPEKYFTGARYCLYVEGRVIVAPGRARLMRLIPFTENEKPQLYK